MDKGGDVTSGNVGQAHRAQALEPSYGGDIGNVGQAPERKP